ncbi:hypothetical protein [Eggerthella lenta]|uniref:Phage protein n=4 Tax=Vequintavirus TaxID=1914852 RepID=A0A653HBX1_9CAUD|nr:hypothetical protein [Eggerthella lenta]AXU22701.1 hypothetical protein Pr121lw_187 [Escherichia phage vB_EcoM-Pr121LW]QEG04652.1 hypothetical protein CM1_00183 [Shigella phage CM1]QXV77790.1 hypothetical protein bas59_0096 [Escherichia phage EduardKellenberger]USL84573.1 putative membrane protein [Escherichia phage I29]VVG93956.1 Phage protein [Escherichia phage rV5_ev146]
MTEIIVSTAGYVFLTIIALAILVAVYGFVILPILETFSLCRCWRKAYGPQPWKDWFHLVRIAFSYAYDHSSSACVTGYHAYNWNWEGLGRWTVTKTIPLRLYKGKNKLGT